MRVFLLFLSGCYAVVTLDGEVEQGPPVRFAEGEAPHNLLIISVDTTRRDHIGFFSGNGLTNNLDAVLDQSVVLADHHSCSNWTAQSMTCVVSGRTEMEQNFATWNSDPLVPAMPGPEYEEDTLATHMADLGKDTLLISANSVFGPWSTGVGAGYAEAINVDYQQAESVASLAAGEIAERVNAGGEWYAHVHFMDPHGPYCAPDDFVDVGLVQPTGLTLADFCADSYSFGGGWYVMSEEVQAETLDAYLALYEGELLYWDTWFGSFWDSLDQMGALDDTLVVFVTDHGQQFFERGGHGHGIYLGPEENRSTAAFWARNLEPRVWAGATIHQDVTATLDAVFGVTPITPRSGYEVGTAPDDRAIRIMNYWGGVVELGVIRDGEQLNYRFNGNREFYRYADDPDALMDVNNPTDPGVIARWQDMNEWIGVVQEHWPHLAPPVDPHP